MRMLVLFLAANLPAHVSLFPSWAGRLLGVSLLDTHPRRVSGSQRQKSQEKTRWMRQSSALQLTMPAALPFFVAWMKKLQSCLPILVVSRCAVYHLLSLSLINQKSCKARAYASTPQQYAFRHVTIQSPRSVAHTPLVRSAQSTHSDCMHGRSTCCRQSHTGIFFRVQALPVTSLGIPRDPIAHQSE
ncbi:hypothetical protein GGI35DRAFT_59145 [Trichoderma velutinum]